MREATDNAATLAAIASSPEAVAASEAHLFAAIDAMLAVYIGADTIGMTPRQIAMRSPSAAWHAAYTHVEHRIAQLKRAQAATPKVAA